MKQAVLALGCFWSPEFKFGKLEGIKDTKVGYAGGSLTDPSYEQVCGGDSGHAEVVRLKYDPEVISYETIIDKFFEMHDPTQHNRQGPDIGSQYRSAIFVQDEEQEEIAKKKIEEKQSEYDKPIATKIEKGQFYLAEDYHQKYFEKHPIRAKFMCG